jgi:hypothetical protein
LAVGITGHASRKAKEHNNMIQPELENPQRAGDHSTPNNEPPQGDSPDSTAAGQNTTTTENADQLPDSEPDTDDDHDDNGDDQDGGKDGNKEAAKWRVKFREAERRISELEQQIAAMHQDVVNEIAAEAGLPDVGLLAAAGYQLDGFIADDGAVDRAKVADACRDTMSRYRIAPKGRVPQPNLQQGAYGPPQRQPGAEFIAAFAPRPPR